MYVAIARFADLMDGKRIYEAGDTFPRPGLNVTPERLKELEGCDNLARKPLIVNVDAPCDACRVDAGEAPMQAVEMPAQAVDMPAQAVEMPAEAEPPARKPRIARKRAAKGADGQ